MTRWPRYFHGLNMADVALLAYAANLITEPALVLLGGSTSATRTSFSRAATDGCIIEYLRTTGLGTGCSL